MKEKTQNILAVVGAISTVMGIIIVIPSFVQGRHVMTIGAIILTVGGLALITVSCDDKICFME